jgi:aspartate/methionine/tyrosine aminotransferase
LGAFVTKNKALYDVALKFAQMRISPPGLAQLLGEAATDLPPTYFDATKTEYLARRDLMVRRPQAGARAAHRAAGRAARLREGRWGAFLVGKK